MRVAHILRKYVPAEWGGTESAIHGLVRGLREHGVESTVYCPAVSGFLPAAGRDPIALTGARLQRFRAVVPIWGLSDIQRRRMIAVGGNLLSFELPRLLAREPDLSVIHAHTLGRLGGCALQVARRRKLPFVVTIHGGVLDLPEQVRREMREAGRGGVEWGRLFGWWWRARRLLSDADLLITCNAREAEALRAKHPGKQVVVQPHGVPLAQYRVDHRAAALAAFPRLADSKLVLCVGRIDAVKNQAWLVRQAPQFLQAHPQSRLVLVGSAMRPGEAEELQGKLAGPEFEGRADYLGGLPPGDPRLIGLLQSASVVVLPSISETFGLVILEAWAAGVPVLASGTSGASALIQPGVNGWLFDLSAPGTFHAALRVALREPDVAAEMARAGRRLVERDYDTAVLAGRVRRLYGEIQGGAHAHGDRP